MAKDEPVPTDFSSAQKDRFAALEKDIAGQQRFFRTSVRNAENSFLLIGKALAEISDKRLYRIVSPTFEDYCLARWGYKRSYAYQLIDSSKIVKQLPRAISDVIDNPAKARALASVPEEKRAEVVQNVKKSGKPATARSIQTEGKKVDAPAKEILCDKTGVEIPESVQSDWDRAVEFGFTLSKLSEIVREVQKKMDEEDNIFAEVRHAQPGAALKNIHSTLKHVLPYAVCPTCKGHQRAKCSLCKTRGFISEYLWEACVPKETRDMRKKNRK